MKRVLVSAYCSYNLGDDLFLKILFEKYPHVIFSILTNNKNYTLFERYKNVNIIETPNVKRIYWALSNYFKFTFVFKSHFRKLFKQLNSKENDFDSFLLIGGSVFMEIGSSHYKKEFFSLIYSLFINKPKFIIGANFGPYKSNNYKLFFKNIFEKSSDVCFRDKYSYLLFNDIKTVRYASDIVFQLNYRKQHKVKRSVGFSIIDVESRRSLSTFSYQYQQLHKMLIEAYIKDDYQVNLFSFCQTEGDMISIYKIIKTIKPELRYKIKVFNYDGNIDSLLFEFSKNELVYCSRFHSMILALMNNQNIFPFVYSDKMTNVLSDMNFNGKYLRIENINISYVNEIRMQILSNTYDVSTYNNNSKIQFKILNKYLLDE
jgi:colanic acid/amylovoran biosynthesis protein